MTSERAASVNILFSIAESFPPILERCTTRKNDNFLSSSVFIRNVTERQITQRAMYIYIYIVGDTYIYIQAKHLRNHVSVPLLRSHACSSPQFPRASIEERFHGAMLAILASIDVPFHPLVSLSNPFREYLNRERRERIFHLVIDDQFHMDVHIYTYIKGEGK